MEKQNNIPRLRFPEFIDIWEQCKVLDITSSYSGGTPQAGNPDYYNGDIPFIRSGEINKDQTELFLTQSGMENSSAKMVSKGDILYALYGATSGEVSRANIAGAINQAILAILPNEKCDSNFLVEWFRKEKSNIIDKYLQGGQGNLSAQIIKNLEINIPSFNEQEKIGDYFSELNNLITFHQRKLDQMKEYKKGMLQKMFPKDGKTVPEIRFPGFEGDWKLKKFSDFTWFSGKRNKENLDLEPYAITNVNGFIPQNEAHNEFGYMIDTDRTAYNIVTQNSFAYNPARINVGSIGYYDGAENVIVSSLYEVFQTAEYVNDRFLWHWFKSENFSKWIGKLQEGSVRLYFYYDKLCECEILMPFIDEQKLIANHLDEFNNLITLQQRKLEQIKEYKKGLLQQMFV